MPQVSLEIGVLLHYEHIQLRQREAGSSAEELLASLTQMDVLVVFASRTGSGKGQDFVRCYRSEWPGLPLSGIRTRSSSSGEKGKITNENLQ